MTGRSFSTHLFPSSLTCTGRSRFVPRGFSIPAHYARQRGDPFNVIPSVTVVGNCRSQLQIRTHSCAILNWSRIKAWLPGIFCKRKLPRSLLVWYSYSKILVNGMFFSFSHLGISLKHKDQYHLQSLDCEHSLMLLSLGNYTGQILVQSVLWSSAPAQVYWKKEGFSSHTYLLLPKI